MAAMTIVLPTATSHLQPDTDVVPAADDRVRQTVLRNVFDLLDDAGIPYCVLDGYEAFGRDGSGRDIDCVMPASVLPLQLARRLHTNARWIGADVVLWSGGPNHYITLVARGTDREPRFIHLDVHPGYQRAGRLFYSAEDVLSTRRRYNGIWVPATDVEFGCYLVKKIANRWLSDEHGSRLSVLYRRDPAACERQIARFWGFRDARLIDAAAVSGNWQTVIERISLLRTALLYEFIRRHPLKTGRGLVGCCVRRVKRVVTGGAGVAVVLLGSDGVGKSTVIDRIVHTLRPLFAGTLSRNPAPAVFVRSVRNRVPGRPHSMPQRPVYQSIFKAAYWLFYYTLDHYRTVRPAIAGSKLVLFHRHLLDTIVDPRRYRYGGPLWLVRLIARLLPTLDLVILLDAPPEVIQARKQEVPLEETARQRAAYRALIETLPNGHVVDATPPSDEVSATVSDVIVRYLSDRTVGRLRLGASQ